MPERLICLRGRFRKVTRHPRCTTRGRVMRLATFSHQRLVELGVGRNDPTCWNALVAPARAENEYVLNMVCPMGRHPFALEISGKRVEVRPGWYVLVNPSSPSRWLPSPYGFQGLKIYFYQHWLRRCREAAGIHKLSGAFDFDERPRRVDGAITHAVRRLDALVNRPSNLLQDVWMPGELQGECWNILAHLWTAHPNRLKFRFQRTEFRHGLDPRVDRALQFVHARFRESVTPRDIAREAGTSGMTLRRLFHAALGLTPRRYLQRYRVEQAELLLAPGEAPTLRVAERVGFQSAWGLRKAIHSVKQGSPTPV